MAGNALGVAGFVPAPFRANLGPPGPLGAGCRLTSPRIVENQGLCSPPPHSTSTLVGVATTITALVFKRSSGRAARKFVGRRQAKEEMQLLSQPVPKDAPIVVSGTETAVFALG